MTKPHNHFTKESSATYDERNRALSAISNNMHFLTQLVLRDVTANARVLCVGVGTGAEIMYLAKAFPGWRFVGVDPSAPMIDVCRDKLKAAGLDGRCELLVGYVDDVPAGETFDVALSMLVGHFIPRADKQKFYAAMTDRLRAGGYLVNTEISFDLDSPEYPSMLHSWEGVQKMMGGTPESLAKLPQMLRDQLSVLSPQENENLLRQSGIKIPVCFFQAFMICGWFGTT